MEEPRRQAWRVSSDSSGLHPHPTPTTPRSRIPESPPEKAVWAGGRGRTAERHPSPQLVLFLEGMMLRKGQDWAPGPALQLIFWNS